MGRGRIARISPDLTRSHTWHDPLSAMARSRRRSELVLILGLALAPLLPACGRAREPKGAGSVGSALVEPAGPPEPEVQAAVQGVLDSGRHPALTWPAVTGVLPGLKALYAAEPDGLCCFASDTPCPDLASAVATLGR